jgi:hypothetical protein
LRPDCPFQDTAIANSDTDVKSWHPVGFRSIDSPLAGYSEAIVSWRKIVLSSFLFFYNLRSFVSANFFMRIMIVGEAAVALFMVYWLNTERARAFFQK